MKSFTALRNLAATWVNRTGDSGVLTQLDGYINDSIRTICNMRNGSWKWLETLPTVATVAGQQEYQIPNKVRKVIDVYIKVGVQVYMPEAVYDQDRWKVVLASRLGTSDIPLYYYIQDKKCLFAPIPATNGNTIYFRGRLNVKDLSIADYTTGSIVSIANGGTAIVGSGTTFTADMVGRYIRITETTAANGGDGFWYEIGSYTSATSIGLLKPYEGTSITAGSAAYTIGQMSPIPESYDTTPVYRAVALYWQNQGELERAKSYWMSYDGGYEMGLRNNPGGLIEQMVIEEGNKVEGSYIPPFGSRAAVAIAPGAAFSPFQTDASGF